MTDVKTAHIFPGQGSQYVGMGKELYDEVPEARNIFDRGDEILDFPLSRLCFEGLEDELKITYNTQPAILTHSMALYELFKDNGFEPSFAAGHSLGEYSALCAAGGLKYEDAVSLVRKRGQYMQEACPRGEGDMAAIIGLDEETVTRICEEEAGEEVLSPANINSPVQTVIAGNKEAVARAVLRASREGAKKAVHLPVSAPFHCELMTPAAERLAEDLRGTEFRPLRFPVIANCNGEPVESGEDARKALIKQVTSPVLWVKSMRKMAEMGADEMVEIGPGNVLRGLQRRIDRKIKTHSVDNRRDFEKYLESMGR